MADDLIIHASLDGESQVTRGLTGITVGVKAVNDATNDLNNNLSTRTNSAFSVFKNKLGDLGVATEGLRSRIENLSTTLGKGLVSGMKLAAVGMIGLGAAAGAMAYETEKNYTQFHNVILNFTGDNQKLTTTLYNQAKQYNDIVSISGQEAGLKQLLVNPNFRSQAGNVNAELLQISAASGNQANTVYSQLTNAVGRIEDRQRMDPRTLLMLQKAGINILPFFKPFGFGNLSPNSPLTMQEATKFVQEIGTPQQMLSFIQTVAKNPGISGAITRQRETPSGAVAYLKAQMENAIDDASGAFDKAISGAIGPVTKMLAGKGGLIQTLAPPLLDFIGKLAQGLSALIPVVQPILKGLAMGFSRALAAIIPAIQKMQPIGAKLGQAFYKFLSAFIPVMPALVNCLVTFMQVLPAITPPLVTMANVFSKLLIVILDFVNGIGKFLNQVGAFKIIGDGIGVIIAGLLGLKAVFMAQDAFTAFKKAFGAEGWFTKAMKGIGNFVTGGKGSPTEPEPPGGGGGSGGSGGCAGCGGAGMGAGECMNLCDDSGTVNSLAKGMDAGLTTSAAGTTMVMSKVLGSLGLIAGATALTAAFAGKIEALLGKTSQTTKPAVTKPTTQPSAGDPAHSTTTHHTATHHTTTQTTHHGTGTGTGTGTHTGHHGPGALSTALTAAGIGLGAALIGGTVGKIIADLTDKGKGGKGGNPPGPHVAPIIPIRPPAPALVPAVGHGGATITSIAKNLAVQQAIAYLGGAAIGAGATGADELLGFLGLSAGGVAGLAGAAAAKGLPKKLKDEQYNPKLGDTYSAGSSTPTEVHIHIGTANFHDVQDVKTLKAGLKKVAQDNMVRGTPNPSSWRSPGWGHTAVNDLGKANQ